MSLVLSKIEFLLCFLILLKILLFKIKNTLKDKKHNCCFWLYLWTSLLLILNSVLQGLSIYQSIYEGPEFLLYLNPTTLDYFKNITFIGFCIYLVMSCYKVTNIYYPEEKLESISGVKKKILREKRFMKLIILWVPFLIFLQTILVGFSPFLFNSSVLQPAWITSICILLCVVFLICLLWSYKYLKSLFRPWILYLGSSFLMMVSSLAVNYLNYFQGLYLNGELYLAISQAPMITFRILQLGSLFIVLISKNMEYCYD